ncbi:hypothetical protein TWF569_010589 [Orbilia oligospora]|uniref:AB hydrolase-1 domain-containing protein n=1 Tax=Orbilia oligospora TaxID=2813651 RepID=A0A7C8NUQ1_ORBOL|nr:hypothetical protein TWF703_008995 [Orbilia oligospora]KAF3154969.1 hypothetical protein TWF569_010589 [Orbilia oligospora]
MADQDDSEKHGLFFLNEAQFTQLDETEILYPVDIVAIHGINGGAYETWRHMNGTLWLQDLLPADLPGCRVFTSGYSSATAFGSSAEELDDVAFAILLDLNFQRPSIKEQSRPVIFLGHSIGGILVKQAINLITTDLSYYAGISDCVRGVVFLSTPHRSSHKASFSETLEEITMVAHDSDDNDIRAQMRGSIGAIYPLLDSITSRFGERVPAAMHIISCIEQNTPPGFRSRVRPLTPPSFTYLRHSIDAAPLSTHQIVDDVCGWMNHPQEDVIRISSDHLNVCRFKDRECSGYLELISRLQKLAFAPPPEVRTSDYKPVGKKDGVSQASPVHNKRSTTDWAREQSLLPTLLLLLLLLLLSVLLLRS